jgi:type 1 fimbria pilin
MWVKTYNQEAINLYYCSSLEVRQFTRRGPGDKRDAFDLLPQSPEDSNYTVKAHMVNGTQQQEVILISGTTQAQAKGVLNRILKALNEPKIVLDLNEPEDTKWTPSTVY